jgi:hypothetical protein
MSDGNLIIALGRTLGFSFAAGINLYATVAILGLATRFGWVDLPPQYRVFDNNSIIGAAIVLYLVEFVADKIPWVDSFWDAIHTVVRPGAESPGGARRLMKTGRPETNECEGGLAVRDDFRNGLVRGVIGSRFYAVLRRGRTFGLRPRAIMACQRSHFTCSVSQICASQPVSAWSRSAVSALTARRPLIMAFSRWKGMFMRAAAST